MNGEGEEGGGRREGGWVIVEIYKIELKNNK